MINHSESDRKAEAQIQFKVCDGGRSIWLSGAQSFFLNRKSQAAFLELVIAKEDALSIKLT